MDAHGRNERRLTRTRNNILDGAPSWSPDGSHIAFDRTGLEFREIYVMNRNGRALRRLTRSIDEKRWPAWSPDGRTIAFVSSGENDKIHVMNANGSSQHQLTRNARDDDQPAWRPFLDVPMNRARRITLLGLAVVIVLFAAAGSSGSILPELRADGDDKRLRPSRIPSKSARSTPGSGASGIYGAKIDGSNRHLITRYKGGAPTDGYFSPEWSAKGQSLTYWTSGERIMLRPGGYPYARRSQDAPIGLLCNTDPTWSPDGRQIAFSGENPITSRRPISIVSLAFGRVRRLTKPALKDGDFAPDWSTDGAAIAFERALGPPRRPVCHLH